MASTVMGNMLSLDNQIDVDVYARGEDGRGIYDQVVEFQASNDPTSVPSGTWSTTVPIVQQGQYLWTRITFLFNDQTTMVSYSISYFAVDGIDGENGATFTPSVDSAGNISWTNDKGLPNPTTVNIKGPKGDMGSVKFYYVNVLPTTNIDESAFYVMNAANPTQIKKYDEYFYINSGWEKIGDDLSAFYNKTQIDSMFTNFVATKITVTAISEDTTYYLTGTDGTGSADLYRSGFTYSKATGAARGVGEIDGEQITTGLFYSIN